MDLTLVFLRDQARPLLKAVAFFILPPWFFLALGSWWTEGHWVWPLFAMLIGPVIQVPFVVLGGRLFFASTAPMVEVLKDMARCAWGIIAWLVVDALALLVG